MVPRHMFQVLVGMGMELCVQFPVMQTNTVGADMGVGRASRNHREHRC